MLKSRKTKPAESPGDVVSRVAAEMDKELPVATPELHTGGGEYVALELTGVLKDGTRHVLLHQTGALLVIPGDELTFKVNFS